MKKNIQVSGFTKVQRLKSLEKIKSKYLKKDYKFIEYIDDGITKSMAIFEVDEKIIKKEKKRKTIIVIGSLFIIVFLIFTNNLEKTNKDTQSHNISKQTKILSVSGYSYTLGGEQAVSIVFGSSEEASVNLTILKSDLREGVLIDSTNENISKKLSISFSLKNILFVLHGKEPASYVKLKIVSLNQKEQKAVIEIDAKLFTTNKESSIDIKDRIVLINKNFTNLMKKFN